MVASTWDQLVRDLNNEDTAKLAAYRDFCRGLPDVQERVSSAQVAYAGTRIFTSAYIKSHYLELGIELEESSTGGGSDGNFTAALGIPTLDGLGGVGEGAHAPNESILIDRIADRTALLAKLVQAI